MNIIKGVFKANINTTINIAKDITINNTRIHNLKIRQKFIAFKIHFRISPYS